MKTGVQSFPHIGNNLAIDFLNTEIIDRGEVIELLARPKDYYDWAQSAGIAVDNSVLNAELSTVLEFRNTLKSIFEAILDNRAITQRSLNILNQHLLNDPREQHLIKNSKGKFELQPVHEKYSLESLFGRIASEASLLLSSKHLKKLKKCSNPKCILIFLDISKSGKRRWCSMEVCGNRAKAANYYATSKSQ